MARTGLKLLETGKDREGANYKLYQGRSKKHCLLVCYFTSEDCPNFVLTGDYDYCKKYI